MSAAYKRLAGNKLQRHHLKRPRQQLIEKALAEERERAGIEGREPRTQGRFMVRSKGRRHYLFISEDGPIGEVEALLSFDPKLDPFEGWSPHDLRKTATQALETTARTTDWLVREKPWFNSPVRLLSEMLTNHTVNRRTVEDRYKITPEIADRIAGTATEYLHRLLYSDLGARMVQSPERYRSALLQRRTLNSRIKRMAEERDRLRQQLTRQAINTEDLLTRSDRISEQLDQVRLELAAREIEIAGIREGDPRYRVALPDDAPAGSEAMIPELLEQAHIEVEGRAAFDAPLRERVRNWLTVKEFAAASSVTPAQVGRWLKGQSLPARMKPWAPEHPPLNEELGLKRRRVVVDGLAEDWLSEVPSRRDRIEDFLCDWPTESNWHKFREPEATLD